MLVEKALIERRDQLIRDMWRVFRDLSDVRSPDDFTDEDLNIWTAVTAHSAIQNKFELKKKPV